MNNLKSNYNNISLEERLRFEHASPEGIFTNNVAEEYYSLFVNEEQENILFEIARYFQNNGAKLIKLSFNDNNVSEIGAFTLDVTMGKESYSSVVSGINELLDVQSFKPLFGKGNIFARGYEFEFEKGTSYQLTAKQDSLEHTIEPLFLNLTYKD